MRCRISCFGSRPTANWSSFRSSGPISTASRSKRRSANTSSESAGSAAWPPRPDPDSVAVSGPSESDGPRPAAMSNLALRAISTIVLAPLAVLTAYLGGWPFALFWAAAAIAVLWEWVSLVSGALWIVAGIAYACILWLAPMLLRADQAGGFKALLLLFVFFLTTAVFGFFFGATLGGPKLCAAISPKKTWS